jgi:hypothetical protein
MGSGLLLVGVDAEELLGRLIEAHDVDDSDRLPTAQSRVSACTKAQLEIIADVSGRTESSVIRDFIREGLDRLEEGLLDEV